MEKKFTIIVGILLVFTLGLLVMIKTQNHPLIPSLERRGNVRVPIKITFLDVGQGDATLIQWPDNTQMLIDCGKDARVLEALGRHMAFYDRTIDYLVVTHPDLDHYGGCTDVLKRFDIHNIVYTGVQKNDSAWQYFWQTAQEERGEIHVVTGVQEWSIASTTLAFLYPVYDLTKDQHIPNKENISSANDTSLVLKLSYGTSDMLLTGDAEEALEQYLVQTYDKELDIEILKVGHHGSGSSTIAPFVAATSPQHAMISVGVENRYGHPSPRVLRRLERADSTVWRTDQQGDIVTLFYEDHIDISARAS